MSWNSPQGQDGVRSKSDKKQESYFILVKRGVHFYDKRLY
jgi:hypothetical protein